jgi:hypothetical protein
MWKNIFPCWGSQKSPEQLQERQKAADQRVDEGQGSASKKKNKLCRGYIHRTCDY